MPKTYNQVRDEYLRFKSEYPDDPTDITSFAKQLDEVEGAPGERGAAYEDGMIKQLNAFLDRGFEQSGLPEVSRQVLGGAAGLVDEGFGTNVRPTVEGIATDLPRMITEGALTMVPVVGPAAKGASLLSKLNTARKVAGYGSAATRGTATTDSLLGGAIEAGSLGLSNKLILPAAYGGKDVGKKAAEKVWEWMGNKPYVDADLSTARTLFGKAPELTATTTGRAAVPAVADVAAQVGTEIGINEATRQGQLSVGPNRVAWNDPARNPLSEENIAGNVVSALASTPQGIAAVRRPQLIAPQQLRGLDDWNVARQQWVQEQLHKGETPEQFWDIYGSAREQEGFQEPVWDPVVQEERRFLEQNLQALQAHTDALVDQKARNDPEAAVTEKRILQLMDAVLRSGGKASDLAGLDQEKAQYGKTAKSDTQGLTRDEIAKKEGVPSPVVDEVTVDKIAGEISSSISDSPPKTPVELATFMVKLKEVLKFIDQNTEKFDETQKTEENRGKTWHPNAVEPSLIERYQKEGFLPEVTWDEIKKVYNVTAEEFGNPEFAAEVAVQRFANMVLDRLPDAKARAKMKQVETEYSPSQKLEQIKAKELRDAIVSMPAYAQKELWARTVEEMRREGVAFGRATTAIDVWRKTLVHAQQTFDPLTNTVEVLRGFKMENGKKTPRYERVDLNRLFEKNEMGYYSMPIKAKNAKKGEVGGRSTKEVHFTDLQKEGQNPFDAPEELDEARVQFAEEGNLQGSLEKTEKTFHQERAEQGGEEVVPEREGEQHPVLEETMGDEKSRKLVIDRVYETLKNVDPTTLMRMTQHLFNNNGLSAADISRRTRFLPLAIRAALEDWKSHGGPVGPAGKAYLEARDMEGFKRVNTNERAALDIALKSFFGRTSPVGDLPAKGGRNDYVRFGEIVKVLSKERLGDEIADVASTVGTWRSENIHPSELYEKKGGIQKGVDPFGPKDQGFQDVVRRFSKMIDQKLGGAGYSNELRTYYKHLATALAMQIHKTHTTFSAQTTNISALGQAAIERSVLPAGQRGELSIDVNRPTMTKDQAELMVAQTMQTLAHEIRHINDWIAAGFLKEPDAFSKRNRVHILNMRRLAETLTDDERNSVLTHIRDAFIPTSRQIKQTMNGMEYGAHDPMEFTAQVNAYLDRALLASPAERKNAFNVFEFAPDELTKYANGFYRAYADVAEALHEAVRTDENLPVQQRRMISDMIGATMNAAKEGSRLGRENDINMAAAAKMFDALAQGAGKNVPDMAPDMVADMATEKINAAMPASLKVPSGDGTGPAAAIAQASEVISGVKGDPKLKRQGLWSSWFYPFANLMESAARAGNPLAREIGELSTNLQGGVKRTYSAIMSPLLVQDADGAYRLNKEHALVKKLNEEKNGPWRGAFNRLSAWQQDNGGVERVFVRNEKGEAVVNPDSKAAASEWEKVKKGLKQEDQQVVAAAMVAFDEIGHNAGQRTIAALQKSNAYRVAATLMAGDQTTMTADKALQVAEVVQQAFTVLEQKDATPEARTQAQAVIAQYLGNGPALRRVAMLLSGPEGLIQQLAKVAKKIEDRSGFRTESLPGDWVVQFQKPGAEKGEYSYLSAQSEHKANFLAKKLVDEGNALPEVFNKKEIANYADFDAPNQLLAKFTEVEQRAWERYVEAMRLEHGDAFAEALKAYSPGATTAKEMQIRGMGKYLTERKGKVDRTRLDYIDATMEWAGKLSTSLTYKLTKQHKDLLLADPRMRQFPQTRDLVDPHFENLMTPTSPLAKEMRTLASAYMMGGNLSSALVNATQSITVLIPVLMHQAKTLGPVGAYARLVSAIGHSAEVSTSDGWQRVAAAAEARDASGKTWTAEESRAVLYKRNVQDGGISHGVILDDMFSPSDTQTLINAKFGHGDYGPVTKGEMVKDALYLGAQLSLKPFGWVESFNNKIALMAGVDQGYKDGLRGDALYEYAKRVKYLSTFGGGKANAPGLVSKASSPYTRSAVSVVNVLQQYGYGMVAAYGQQIKDALGNSPGLTPQERRQAIKAFGTMFATQLAVGGALGLPFAAAGLKIVEKLFGVPADQLVREGLASLGREDEEDSTGSGATFAETALNGLANQMWGLDISSRVGVSNILGTSAYRGFNLEDMAGPTVSMMSNMAQALNLFSTNQPEKGMKALVPNALKNSVDLYNNKQKYGDYGIRDAGGDLLYTPTENQIPWYAVGFRPRELSQKRQAQQMMLTSTERSQRARNQLLDGAAQALQAGDTSVAQRLAMETAYTQPGTNPQEVYRQIVQRVVDSQTEKDLLATGGRWNEEERKRIAGTFGKDVVTRQSEVDRARMGAEVGMKLGLRPDPATFRKAAIVDMLVQQRGMPRSQAVRFAEMLQ